MKPYVKCIVSLYLFLNGDIWGISYTEIHLQEFSGELTRMKQGKIYKHLEKKSDSLGTITVAGIIEAPVDVVWKTINTDDRELYPDMLKQEVTVINRQEFIKKTLLDYPWPFSDRWTIYREKIDEKLYGKEWFEIGGDVKINRGAVRLFALEDNSTLMVFKNTFDPGIGAVPDWVIETGMEIIAPRVITRVREYLKKYPEGKKK